MAEASREAGYYWILRHDNISEVIRISGEAIWRVAHVYPELRGPEFVKQWGPKIKPWHPAAQPREEEKT